MEQYENSALDQAIKLKAQVLDSELYSQECSILSTIFYDSIEAGEDPVKLIEVQERLMNAIYSYQEEKSNNKGKEFESVLYRQLLIVCRAIGDSIAWRVLKYNRFLANLFLSHNQTGALNPSSTPKEFERANEIMETEGKLVILNDLTNFLRFGDITIVDGVDIQMEEVKMAGGKNGKATGSNIVRQARNLKNINDYLSHQTSTINIDDINHRAFSLGEFQHQSYMQNLNDLIQTAREQGYAVEFVEPYLSIEVFDRHVPLKEDVQITRPFGNEIGECVTFNSIMPFNDAAEFATNAPYGVMPLSPEDRMDLINERIALRVTLNVKEFSKKYAELGLNLVKNSVTQEMRDRFTSSVFKSPKGSREASQLRQEGLLDYQLSNGFVTVKVSQTYFAKIVMNLINTDTFLFEEKFRISLVTQLIQAGQFVLGEDNIHLIVDESNLWD